MTVTPELEAVAKAIALASLADAGADRERIERLVSKCWDRWLPEARAALMVVRPCNGWLIHVGDQTYRQNESVREAWTAMIDAILGEPARS